jgi:hypothetical protein
MLIRVLITSNSSTKAQGVDGEKSVLITRSGEKNAVSFAMQWSQMFSITNLNLGDLKAMNVMIDNWHKTYVLFMFLECIWLLGLFVC